MARALILCVLLAGPALAADPPLPYPIVDTGQDEVLRQPRRNRRRRNPASRSTARTRSSGATRPATRSAPTA